MKGDFEKGLKALKEQKFEKAKKNFLPIIEQKPENAEAHFGLGIAYSELENVSDAEKHLKASFGLYEAQRKLPEALVSIQELQEMKPGVTKYTFDLLRIYLKLYFMKSFVGLLLDVMDNEETAEDILIENISALSHFIKDEEIKSILTLKKTAMKEEEKLNPFENLELANLLFEIGSTDEARTEYYKTATAFLDRELKDKAQELFVKIKELYPGDDDLKGLKNEIDNYGKQKEELDLEGRKKDLAKKLPDLINKDESRIRYTVAVMLKEFARYGKASRELEKLFQLPKSREKIKACVLQSQICFDQNNEEGAIAVLHDAIESSEFEGKEIVPIQYKLASLHEKSNNLQEALKIYEQALEQDSEYLDIAERINGVKDLIEKEEAESETKKEVLEEAVPVVETPEKEVKPAKFEEKIEEKAEERRVKPEKKTVEKEKKVTQQERILYM